MSEDWRTDARNFACKTRCVEEDTSANIGLLQRAGRFAVLLSKGFLSPIHILFPGKRGQGHPAATFESLLKGPRNGGSIDPMVANETRLNRDIIRGIFQQL